MLEKVSWMPWFFQGVEQLIHYGSGGVNIFLKDCLLEVDIVFDNLSGL